MRCISAVIATNAVFLADILRDKLNDAGIRAVVAGNAGELKHKLANTAARIVFLEHCFIGQGTDAFVQRTAKRCRGLRIVVWAAAEVQPNIAARYIHAGADSFFSLRDTGETIETVLCRIAGGRHYCPADVEAALEKDIACPVIGEKLTSREIEVVKLTVEGRSNKAIGNVLGVTVHTVKYYKQNIYRKCGGNTPVDILRQGLSRGIVCPEDFGAGGNLHKADEGEL